MTHGNVGGGGRIGADERVDRPIWAADRIDGRTLVEVAARPVERVHVPAHSPLAGAPITLRLGGVLPARIRVGRSIPTTNTLENRFVATVLDRCLAIVRTVVAHAARGSSAAMEPLRAEAQQLAATLERWRLHRVLEDLRPLRRLPTTSTVLRGRPGYRDVLHLYADLLGRTRIVPLSAAARIVGLRDIASLYEWWCFFQVVSVVSDILGPPERVDPAAETWQGAELGQGLTAHFRGNVRVEFNRSFSKSQGGKHRSYSVPLRPDILVETPCERHIFDAKFAFEPLGSFVGGEDDDSEDESPAGRARRWNIHKMHTYRDALDRVASVRVLYPGSTDQADDDPDRDPGRAREGDVVEVRRGSRRNCEAHHDVEQGRAERQSCSERPASLKGPVRLSSAARNRLGRRSPASAHECPLAGAHTGAQRQNCLQIA